MSIADNCSQYCVGKLLRKFANMHELCSQYIAMLLHTLQDKPLCTHFNKSDL